MTTAKKVLQIAKGEVGYCRYDDPEAGTKYGRWYEKNIDKNTGNYDFGQSGVPFCAMFVSWVFNQAGATSAGIPGAYCPWIVNAGKSAGKTVSASKAEPGDIVLFDWGADGESDHVGIVVSNDQTNKRMCTIEGNVTISGRDGCVAECSRAYSLVCCVIRPDWKTAADAIKETVTSKKRLNGIDIASYQGDIAKSVLKQCDFVIVKATEDVSYVNPWFKKVDEAIALGKKVGIYHFATVGDAVAQADYFLKKFTPYISKALPVLDWEAGAIAQGTTWAKKWLDRVYDKTGVRPVVYMSKSVARSYDWSAVRKAGYGLWFAQYPGYDPVYGFQSDPWTDSQGTGAWEQAAMFQYTSSGRLDGYSGPLDFDLFYGSASTWDAYVGAQTAAEEPKTVATYSIAGFIDLQEGDDGDIVKTLQAVMARHGNTLSIDGDFGAKTAKAVRKFQKSHGLSVDGLVGAKTWAALLQ